MPVELKNVLKVVEPCGLTYFLGTLTPKEIKQLTFVPVVNLTERENATLFLVEKPGGYQRAGDSKRMDVIRDFVKRRPDCLIPPVVLSARGKWEFSPVSKQHDRFGTIEALEVAAIIDGQHRLGGLLRLVNDDDVEEALKSRPIPFMAIEKMDMDLEKQEFVDINYNQQGVKKSLIHYLNREDTFAGKAAAALMEDEESPFKGRIDSETKHPWTLILFGAAKECVDEMFGEKMRKVVKFNPNDDKSLQEQGIEFVLQYWRAIQSSLPDFWVDMDFMPALKEKKTKEKPGTSAFNFRLLEETGIRAFSRLADFLFHVTWIDGMRQPSLDSIKRFLTELGKRDIVRKSLTKPSKDPSVLQLDPDLKSSGKAGVKAIYLHLEAELQQVMKQQQ
jgi:DGQHR domain-containing protein